MNRLLIVFALLFSMSAQTQEINKTDSRGKKQGAWKKAYKNVKVFRYMGQFKDNIAYGKFIYYYETGAVQAVVYFSDNGKVTRSQMYHNSGYMMARGKYINQKKDSIWVYYDDRGTISYQETYKNGELNGQKVYFYAPKSKKLLIARYEYYKNSLLHGEFKEYHKNTKVKTAGKYRDGNLHGPVTHYYPDGKIKKVAHYKYAVKHGNWSFFDEKGVLLGTKMFWEGKLVKGPQAEEKKKLWKEQGQNG